jgi:sulfite exporter TauE/SafE
VSFVCGLVGLLVANLVLGPLAIVLGAMGLRADKNRRVRAVLGILLGVADIAVFLFLAAHSGAHHGSVSWNFFGN